MTYMLHEDHMTSSEKMNAYFSSSKRVVLIFTCYLFFKSSCEIAEPQVCSFCGGSALNGSAVGQFCTQSAGRISGRCCWTNHNTSDHERIIGVDLSNCSLTFVGDLKSVSTAAMIDLSINPIVNMSDAVFEGFSHLNYLILPQDIACPGGNASWEKVEFKEKTCVCEGQTNMCNQTGHLSMNCPENSICAPYGPGMYQCSCAGNYHGYKCLREGEFPAGLVFWYLAAATVVISFILWLTQRRKAKSL